MQPASSSPQYTASQLNAAARAQILNSAIEMTQPLTTVTFNPTTTPVLNIPPRNVGLIKKFIVKVTATVNNTDGANASAISDFGLSNLLSSVVFTDLSNNVRIQTSGLHLAQLFAARHRWALGQVDSVNLESSAYGNNFGCVLAPTAIAKGGTATVQQWYEIPIAYSDEDLRGAIYANVVNATMNLALTVNPAPCVAAGSDSTFAVYKGAAGNISSVTISVYQVYLDQLPMAKGGSGVVLPQLDLSTIYELKNTNFSAITAGQDFPIPYANFRTFLSTFLLFNHDGSADAGRTGGTDVNYISLMSANTTNIWKREPALIALESRKLIFTDWPNGLYYLGSRKKPIETTTYGNMQLNLNAITAASQAYVNVAWEDFALINTLSNSGSLAG